MVRPASLPNWSTRQMNWRGLRQTASPNTHEIVIKIEASAPAPGAALPNWLQEKDIWTNTRA